MHMSLKNVPHRLNQEVMSSLQATIYTVVIRIDMFLFLE